MYRDQLHHLCQSPGLYSQDVHLICKFSQRMAFVHSRFLGLSAGVMQQQIGVLSHGDTTCMEHVLKKIKKKTHVLPFRILNQHGLILLLF